MKIMYMNRRHGVVKLQVENLDDLWYLSGVINKGDLVRTKTERRIKAREDMARSKKGERRVFTLTVRVEKADFNPDSETYRISGIVEQGPEDLISMGSHHTFNVEKGTTLKIIKERWSPTDLDRLREAEKAARRPKILIVVVDEGEATFGLIRESKIEYHELSRSIGGKYDIRGRRKRKMEFYGETAKFLSEMLSRENISAIIIAGAGFEKENFRRFLSEKYPELAEKSVMENISSHGRNGVSEVMKRSKIKKIIEEITSARDVRLVHELLTEIGKDSGLGIYGLKDIETAAGLGAIKKLLICDNFFLKNRKRLEDLMYMVKSARGEVHLINHRGEAGRQLNSLGGVAALLRYPGHQYGNK